MAYGVVYLITNKVNGKHYVGQTKQSIEERFKQHTKADTYIGNAIRKYGAENFTIEILAECETQEEMDERERFFVEKLDCKRPKGYNCTDGGEGIRGFHHTEETKAQISATMTGSKQTDEHRANSSAAQRKRFEDPAEHEKATMGQLRRYEDPAEHAKTSAALKKSRAENPLSPESHAQQAKSLKKYYDEYPEARAYLADKANKQFESPESRKRHSEIMTQYYAEHPISDETRAKQSAVQKARQARLRREKVANENLLAASVNVSLQELKAFHAENPIQPRPLDEKKARRMAKRLAAVAEQNRRAARFSLKKLPQIISFGN